MICKDCIHCKVCTYSPIGKLCTDFKDKTQIIELPCKVGDTVYYYCETFGVILPYFIETFSIVFYKTSRNCYTFEANAHSENDDELLDYIDFDIEDVGKTVFLTYEEAEKALKGMEK